MEDIRRLLVYDHRSLGNIARVFWNHDVSNELLRNRVLSKDGKSIDQVVNFDQLM